MNDLINVKEDSSGTVIVSGRELHEFLEIKTRYNDWFNRMTSYGFDEGQDYSTITQKRVTVQNNLVEYNDHALTISMAKELSMIQRNEKGKQARRYFLKVEEAWNSPEMVMKRALQIADRQIKSLEERIEQDKPKTLFADSVSASPTSILIGDLAKLLKQNGVDVGQNKLFGWLRSNGYLIKRKGNSYNMPTQRSMDAGLFEIKETTINRSNGLVTISKTPKVTGKGQIFFINKFLGGNNE